MKGHVRQRGRSLEVRVYAGKGKTVTRTVRWQGSKKATKDTADRILREMLADFDTADGGIGATVNQLVKRWWAQNADGWSPTTRAARESYLRLHVLPALGDMKVRQVGVDDIDAFYVTLRDKGLSPSTIRRSVHSMLVNIFDNAARWKWTATNPAANAKPPKRGGELPEVHPPTDDEVRALLDLAREAKPDLYVFVTLAADTGARRGELCGLRWSAVDLEHGEVSIEGAVVLDGAHVVEKGTKSGKARKVALGAVAAQTLREHRSRAVETAMAMGAHPGPFVFSTDCGATPWRPDGATARFMKLRNEAGLPHVRLHDLRHALVTQWLAEGVDPRTVMGRVGHSTMQMQDRYAHFLPAKDREAAERLGGRLSPATTGHPDYVTPTNDSLGEPS